MASILFTTTRGPLSWLIRMVTRSEISHCALGLEWMGVPVVLHADLEGVVVAPRDRFRSANQIVKEFECPPLEEETLRETVGRLSLPYDFASLFGHLPVVWGRWLRRKVRNPFRDPNRLVCSELVALLLSRNDEEIASEIDSEDCTPQDILSLVERKYPPIKIE